PPPFVFVLTPPPPPRSTPFPYTTLFRSEVEQLGVRGRLEDGEAGERHEAEHQERTGAGTEHAVVEADRRHEQQSEQQRTDPAVRSEEHTSELQSRENLVCRLLLEKKKIK